MTALPEKQRTGPALPEPRGPLSEAVLAALSGNAGQLPVREGGLAPDPYGEDLQLALYVLYELHYQGFADVADEWEWDPELLGFRAELERHFLDALYSDVPAGADTAQALSALLVEPVGFDPRSVSHHLEREGELWQLREYAVLRSLYHLKEADPHAWVLPRLRGRAKAGMAAIEYDEFGAGRSEEVHARLFADLMTDLGLDTTYGRHLDAAPAAALATVNVISLFGLHRALRGALIGNFATVEVTSPPAARRLASALRRAGAGPAAARFYDEHVEADAVHEQVVRHEVVDGLLASEPELDAQVAFGIGATVHLEHRLSAALLDAWRDGGSALRKELGDAPGTQPKGNQ